jgi:hypothetical protein
VTVGHVRQHTLHQVHGRYMRALRVAGGAPPRPLHEKATSSSSLQLSQRTRAKPCASTPHSRYLAKSRSTYRGRPRPSSLASDSSVAPCFVDSDPYFYSCGTTCPAGYHPTRLKSGVGSCPSPYNTYEVTCYPNTGTWFTSCGTTCPAGYYVGSSSTGASNCPAPYNMNQVTCYSL